MTDVSTTTSAAQLKPLAIGDRAGLKDRLFRYLTMGFGLLALALIVWIGFGLYRESAMTRHLFGWRMVTGSTWDVVHDVYGAWPFFYGTLVTSAIALVLAAPLGIGAALFLAEIAPRWLSTPTAFLIELLAAVPSVIFGLWGFLALCPWLQDHLYPWLTEHFGSVPLFAPPAYITNVLAAGIILAIMVLPFVTSVSREVIRTVPAAQREASLGLGATRWETIRSVVLRGASSGIVGAIILALGRAVGETMAVVMVIGNNPQVTSSLLQPGYTMPSLLANQFNEAQDVPIQRSALIEIALILFVITLLVNGLARLLILFSSRAGSPNGSSVSDVLERVRELAGLNLKVLAAVALVGTVLLQIVADIRTRGVRGLAGPVELAVIAVAVVAAMSYGARGTCFWVRWRKLVNGSTVGVMAACAGLACLVLGLLLGYVCVQGAHGLNLSFFTQDAARPPDDPTGGMKNGIVGTLVLIGSASAIGVPVGVLGGVFLSEFGKNRVGGVVRFAADVLNGIPSVVIGMFAYAVFVLPFHQFSAAAGGAALGIMMIPTVMRTTEEMLRQVPGTLREASLGLGATRARTIWTVVMPAARAGIITGIMLAVARIAGETAPLLFTAFGNDFVSAKLSQPTSSMTMMIYKYAMSPYPAWIARAWAGALVLVLMVLAISVLARFATRSRYAMR